MTLFINLAGLALMGLIVWWFWLYRPARHTPASGNEFTITVADGVYEPAQIHAPAGQPLTLHFIRKDASPCSEQVVFHGLDQSVFLESGKTTTVTLDKPPAGQYRFTCQMQMYQGRLIVD